MKKIFKKIITFSLFALVLGALIFGGFRVLGYTPYSVESESMLPDYTVGSLVYVKETRFDDLRSGDVITFVNDDTGTIVTHRIIAIDTEDRSVKTQGDNNEYPDIKPVFEENIIGKVDFSIPKIGKISKNITEFFQNFSDKEIKGANS